MCFNSFILSEKRKGSEKLAFDGKLFIKPWVIGTPCHHSMAKVLAKEIDDAANWHDHTPDLQPKLGQVHNGWLDNHNGIIVILLP